MKTYDLQPNFSIVAPGGCNAECDFCFNKDKKPIVPKNKTEYLWELQRVLSTLPSQFSQISITGNEPLISPYLDEILYACRKMKAQYPKVVLNTNGTNILTLCGEIRKAVNHINISRHATSFEANKAVFKGNWIVRDEFIEEAVDIYGARGIDISLNCVIPEDVPKEFIFEYVQYAKRLGVFAVHFRKISGSLTPTEAEESLADTYDCLSKNNCPVCASTSYLIKGMPVIFKKSLTNPIETINDAIYELVFDADDNTYLDWNRSVRLEAFLDQYNTSIERLKINEAMDALVSYGNKHSNSISDDCHLYGFKKSGNCGAQRTTGGGCGSLSC